MTSIQRGRGYRYEKSIVDRINACRGWRAWRLGGTQIALPDVLAVHNESSTLLVIEAKTGLDNTLYVKAPQARRVLQWCDNLSVYKEKYAILAFYFHNSGRTGSKKKAEYFYQIWSDNDFRCNRRGYLEYKSRHCDLRQNGCWHQTALWSDNFDMPWRLQ